MFYDVFFNENSEIFLILSVSNGKKNDPILINFVRKSAQKIREYYNFRYTVILDKTKIN